MDAIAELERQLQAAASTPDAAERTAKLRYLRDRLNDLLGEADRLLANSHRAREAVAAGRSRRRMAARDGADMREAALEDGDLTPDELDGAGFLSHADLDELAEEGLPLEEALLIRGRGGRTIRFDPGKHPRGLHGKFADVPDVGPPPERLRGRRNPGVPREKPIEVADVDEAIRLLGEGKHVQLNQPDEVSTLVDKLAEIVKEAEAKGEKAPDYDLCRVSVKGTNLFCAESKGVERAMMPQLKGVPVKGTRADSLPRDKRGEVDLSSLFREHLVQSGVKVERTTQLASHMRASQRELNGVKVSGIAHYLRTGGTIEGPPIFVSRNDYIVDGHHRWAAEVAVDYDDGKPDAAMAIDRIDMDIIDVLDEANLFAHEWGLPQAGFGQGFGADPGEGKARKS